MAATDIGLTLSWCFFVETRSHEKLSEETAEKLAEVYKQMVSHSGEKNLNMSDLLWSLSSYGF